MKAGDIYLFCGEDEFLKDEATKAILSKVCGEAPHHLISDIYNAKEEDRDIFGTLNSPPFLSDRRIVVIKDIEHFSETKKDLLLAYLKRPPAYITLILWTNLTPLGNNFIRAVSGYANTTQFNKPDRRRVTDWIHARLNLCKKGITKKGLELLLELKGIDDLAIIKSELDKLVSYAGGEGTIKEEDVAGLVGRSAKGKVSDIINALSRKDTDTAISIAREISADRKTIPQIMGFLGWHLRRLYKTEPRRVKIDRIKKCFKLVLEADRRIKGGEPKPEFLLEQLILSLGRLL